MGVLCNGMNRESGGGPAGAIVKVKCVSFFVHFPFFSRAILDDTVVRYYQFLHAVFMSKVSAFSYVKVSFSLLLYAGCGAPCSLFA